MKIFIKKHLSLLIAFIFVLSSIFAFYIAFADTKVEISETNFPDENFRNAVSMMYDVDKDGYLSLSERRTETMIVSGILETYAFENDIDEDDLFVNSLEGIEYFIDLKSLRCSSIGIIEELDVSELDKLETLACNDLGIKSIDLSQNKALVNLSICSNDIEELDLSANTNLLKLHCYSNDKLKSINLSGLNQLEELRCDCCSIETLDLSTNTKLNYLNCSYNHLTQLDLSANTELVSDGNSLSEYNIGHQTSTAYLKAIDDLVIAELDLDEELVQSTSLDEGENKGYANGYFFTDDSDNIVNGIDYSYNTGISDSAFLTVHLDVIEKEHYYLLNGFDFDECCAEIKCPICKQSYDVNFDECINTRQGNKKYCEHLDAVGDGIINAKDFAKLVTMYNK